MLSNFDIYKNIVHLRRNIEDVVDDLPVYEEPVRENIIDYVLTYSTENSEDFKQKKIDDFLQNLKNTGLLIKETPSAIFPDTVFVLLYGTKGLLTFYASFFGIELSCDNPYFQRERHRGFRIFACKVNATTPDDPEFKKAPDTFSGERPREITKCERIMVTFQILRNTHYGPMSKQYGILRLLEKKVFTSAYPLHEYHHQWSSSYLTDRELLIRYWANPKCFFKRQPLNLIEKYFGSEVGFYFAFLRHYIIYMSYASIIGACCFIYGLVTLKSAENFSSFQICSSNVTICPSCPNFKVCKYLQLRDFCFSAHITYILDNQATVCYAVIISIWTTIYFELWKRQEAIHAYQWNVFSSNIDVSVRPEYEVTAHLKRLSPITKDWEYYEAKSTQYRHAFISYSVVILLAIVALMVVIAIRLYTAIVRALLGVSDIHFVRKYSSIVASGTASTLSVIIMLILETVYVKVAKRLTNLENPRTEIEYDNSFIYKRFILTFINGYAVTCYVAFFQGKFYGHPGKLDVSGTHMQYHVCDPAGCSINLAIHLVIILFIKSFLMNVWQVIRPILMTWLKKRKSKHFDKLILPVWEEEFSMPGFDRFYLVNEYQEIALQYGFVAFFSSALTLTPVFALLHALISIRVDGQKFVLRSRRPVPVRTSGILAWDGIFRSITLIGVVVNAFVIGFTMDFIPREIYIHKKNITHDFIRSTLSIFDTDDYVDKLNFSHPKTCYYKAQRYPPEHPNKYTLTKDYWFELTARIAFIVVYEQLVFALTAILSYAIPDIPKSVKQKVEYEKTKLLKKSLAELESKSY